MHERPFSLLLDFTRSAYGSQPVAMRMKLTLRITGGKDGRMWLLKLLNYCSLKLTHVRTCYRCLLAYTGEG